MKNTLAYFFTFLTFFYTFMSCAPETKTINSESIDFTQIAQKSVQGISEMEIILNDSRNPIPTNWDQETIDNYAVALGMNPDEITVEMVNAIISEMGVATTEGVYAMLDNYDLNLFTKVTLTEISNGNYISDLLSLPEYSNLAQNERDLLQLANTITQIELNEGRSCAGWGGVGAVIGALIGGLLCAICIIGGAIVGGSIGCGAGGGKGDGDGGNQSQD